MRRLPTETHTHTHTVRDQIYLDKSIGDISKETRERPRLLSAFHTHCILGAGPEWPRVQQLHFDLPPVRGAVRPEDRQEVTFNQQKHRLLLKVKYTQQEY